METNKISETVLDSNVKETVLDKVPGDTYLDDNVSDNVSDRVVLKPGQTIAKNYVVVNSINLNGSQANIYIARREGKKCVIKLYNRGYKPFEDFVGNLKNHKCPYIATLLDYGYENDTYYEIYDYYENGTLEEKGKCTLTFIKDIVVPNLNEGLHFLHTFNGTGIVHGDIKPSNIFISTDEKNVIIGDFGISSYLDKTGKIIDEIKGTPEYSPRTVSFFGKHTKTAAYDYGSFGLLLIKLATGHSLFEGLDMAGITEKWEEGIKIPTSIDSRLSRLISGLLIEDESKRFGYEEVKKWCEGEFLKISDNNIYSKEDFEDEDSAPSPLIFGIFDEKLVTVTTLKELSDAISDNWEHTKKQLKRQPFYEFIAQFDKEIEKDVREYSNYQDGDKAVFFTLYRIRKNPTLIYKGKNYGGAKEFVSRLNEDPSSEMVEIIKNGLFEFYLKTNGYNPTLINQIHEAINSSKNCPEFLPYMLYFSFNSEKSYEINGKSITKIDELVDEVVKLELENIEALTKDIRLMAWLYSMGYQDEIINLLKL